MLRLGCDLDGVLADLEGSLRLEAQRLWPGKTWTSSVPGTSVPGDDVEPALTEKDRSLTTFSRELTSSQERRLWREVRGITNFWETLSEIEGGTIQRLFEMSRARRWEVLFLTSRPWSEGDTVQLQSQRWLDRLGFEHPSVFVVNGSRGKIAAALGLDVVIDDRPENCLDVMLESKARPILIWRGDAASIPASAKLMGMGGVSNVNACLDILEQADSTSNESSFVDRLKRLLGLKASSQPTSASR